MNQILANHREYADVYIDDIIIHSRTLAEHVRHVRAILADLRQEELYAKRKKCSFAQAETTFADLLLVRLESVRKRKSMKQSGIGLYL